MASLKKTHLCLFLLTSFFGAPGSASPRIRGSGNSNIAPLPPEIEGFPQRNMPSANQGYHLRHPGDGENQTGHVPLGLQRPTFNHLSAPNSLSNELEIMVFAQQKAHPFC